MKSIIHWSSFGNKIFSVFPQGQSDRFLPQEEKKKSVLSFIPIQVYTYYHTDTHIFICTHTQNHIKIFNLETEFGRDDGLPVVTRHFDPSEMGPSTLVGLRLNGGLKANPCEEAEIKE